MQPSSFPIIEKEISKEFTKSSEIAIKVENLSKCYQIFNKPHDRLLQMLYRGRKKFSRDFWALNNISFEIKKGETIGIIGKNGSGKSTLLQSICGTLNPTSGSIQTHGRIAALLELGFGFDVEFTGRENILMNAMLLGLSKEEIETQYDKIVDFADIGEFIDQPLKTYSSGMTVRLAFAVVAHVKADILIIDEALSVGDAFFVQKCMRFLRNFMKTGTILFVSHDMGAILNFCNKAIWLENGSIKAQGKPKEITELYLEKQYKAESGEELYPSNGSSIPDEEQKSPLPLKENGKQPRDMRLDFINQTNLRNDIELFPFTPDSSEFGIGGAKVLSVQLTDSKNQPLSWVVGGEAVRLVIHAEVNKDIDNVIIGFQVKDRLGQVVFGDNSFLKYLSNPVHAKPNDHLEGIFDFQMPLLPNGDYTIMVAIADGTQEKHLVLNWIHDALAFRVHTTSVVHGLIGVPMKDIQVHSKKCR